MFTILDSVNRFLNYFDFSPTIKNRIYTVVGGVANAYLFYVGFKFLANHLIWQGLLFVLVSLILVYFLFLNIIFYFTSYKAPFDISPKIEKLFGIKPKPTTSEDLNKPLIDDLQNPRKIPMNGFYDPKHVLPAKIISTPVDLRNIEMIAHDMLNNGLMTNDYAGLTERQLTDYLEQSRKPAYAICAGAFVPHFNLKFENGNYVAYAGINQAHLLRIGTVNRIGLQNMQQINHSKVKLFAASAIMIGGNFKISGRAGSVEQQQSYKMQMRIAFKH